jgi:hypothetical protein
VTDPRDQPATEETPFDEWEHRDAAKKVSAIYANQVYIQPMAEGLIRVNFGEVMDEDPSYHTAIVLTPANCLLFSDLMARMATAVLKQTSVVTPTEPAEPGHGRE